MVFALQSDTMLDACFPVLIHFEHVGLAGKDGVVCPVNKRAAELDVIQNACGIDLAIFRLPLFTVPTLGDVLPFIPPFS